MKSESIGLRVLQVVILSAFVNLADAKECLVDDFDDLDDSGWIQCGDWNERQTPVWEATDGRYCLGLGHPVREPPPPPISVAAEWEHASSEAKYWNGCLRAGFQAGTEDAGTWNTHFVLSLRTDCRQGGYKAMLGPSLNRMSIYRRLAMLQDSQEFAFEQGQHYRVAFCAIGEDISLKYWVRGEAEPAAPQLTARDSLYTKGNIGIGVFIQNHNRGPIVRGCYDNLRFVPADHCAADVDCNDTVDWEDLKAVGAAWGASTSCDPGDIADIDKNCAVGFSDALAVAKSWGQCDREAQP